MGRRAKGKQGAPEPLVLSPNKLGKRKAEVEEKPASRPTKKIKDSDNTSKPRTSKKVRGAISKPTDGKKRNPLKADSDSADGWEDIDDLKAEAKCVSCFYSRLSISQLAWQIIIP